MLRIQNNVEYIPLSSFQELVEFLRRYSSEAKEAIENGSLREITSLDLSGKGLEELPAGLEYLENLTHLDVSGNKLSFFPPMHRNLKTLIAHDQQIS